jgi:poly(3-hydroxybutyrate) depolymerase
MSQQVQLWVGAKRTDVKGPVMFYWHGTGSQSGEAGLLGSAVQEIQSLGGIVASFTTTTGKGQNTGNNVWFTGDFEMADFILGCAIQQLNIDTHRIYTAGCSAGGLQSGAMVYSRSGYLAGAMPNSGGGFIRQLQDPTHVPALITAHGSCSDYFIIYFADTSRDLARAVATAGGTAVDCDHGGGHCNTPPAMVAAQWQFLKDHPFGFTSDPYANGLPASFPSGCVKYPPATTPPRCQ